MLNRIRVKYAKKKKKYAKYFRPNEECFGEGEKEFVEGTDYDFSFKNVKYANIRGLASLDDLSPRNVSLHCRPT